ncbi:MAG: hypothetical protein HY900_15430 [Deltaproteobacteria bacterium]|nr:hypothetical protein [Deltaproteobacteria bacterium]
MLLVMFSGVMLVLVGGSGGVGVLRVGAAMEKISNRTLPAVRDLTGLRVAQLDTVLLTRDHGPVNGPPSNDRGRLSESV